jgi:putative DNA primase/helicase
VLYIDGEMPAVGMQERLRGIVQAQAPDNLLFLSADLYRDGLPDLASREGQAAIERLLPSIEVLVLDNVSTLVRSGVENEAEGWLPVQNWLLRLRRMGKTVIIVHHAGKGGGQRGTSRREDPLDLVLNLRAPDDYEPAEDARFEIHFEKGRGLLGKAKDAFEAKLETRDGKSIWTMRELEDAKLDEIHDLRGSGQTIRQIAKQLGMSKSAVDRALKKGRGQ